MLPRSCTSACSRELLLAMTTAMLAFTMMMVVVVVVVVMMMMKKMMLDPNLHFSGGRAMHALPLHLLRLTPSERRYYAAGLDLCDGRKQQRNRQQQQQQQQQQETFMRAFGHFAMAGNQGNANAQCRMGHMLLMGLGVHRFEVLFVPQSSARASLS
jgi:TPR repeat protein